MPDPLYCKLYIDTDEGIDDLNAELNRLRASISFEGVAVEALLYRNENFNVAARGQTPYEFIENSRYYAEVGTIEEVPKQLAGFRFGVVVLVSGLRQGGRFVTAACDFEDLIADETGWNWTEDQPEPPGRTMQVRGIAP